MDETTSAASPRPAPPKTGTEVASRIADVLLLFAGQEDSLGISQIARRLSLSKAVVHRIVRSLVSRHLIVFDATTRSYRLGPLAALLGVRALRGFDLHRAALPVLTRLQRETNETATVSALTGTQRIYLDQVLSFQEVRMSVTVGRPWPLHAGASSLAILAFCRPEIREAVLGAPLYALTRLTQIRRHDIESKLEWVRANGCAVSLGERLAGAASVATPVIGIDGYPVGSISVCGPSTRFDEQTVDALLPLVCEAGREVSKQMGYR